MMVESEKIKRAFDVLEDRYEECNNRGHLGKGSGNVCGYCYRTIDFETEFEEGVFDNKYSLCDVDYFVLMMDLQRGSYKNRAVLDKFNGLKKIIDEID